MIEKEIKVKISPKQAKLVIQLLQEALKCPHGEKIALIITDLDIQVETVSEFLENENYRPFTSEPLCPCGSEQPITATCLTCGQNLCNECSSKHKCPKTKKK